MKRIEKEDLITAIKNAVKKEYSRRQEVMYQIQVLTIRKLHMNLKLQGIKEYNLVDYTDDLKPKYSVDLILMESELCQMVEDNFNKYERASVPYSLEADSLDDLDEIQYLDDDTVALGHPDIPFRGIKR